MKAMVFRLWSIQYRDVLAIAREKDGLVRSFRGLYAFLIVLRSSCDGWRYLLAACEVQFYTGSLIVVHARTCYIACERAH